MLSNPFLHGKADETNKSNEQIHWKEMKDAKDIKDGQNSTEKTYTAVNKVPSVF